MSVAVGEDAYDHASFHQLAIAGFVVAVAEAHRQASCRLFWP